jgi:hypothetical protein
VGRRWTVALLVCLLVATSIVQVAHYHKDNASPHHACTVCATHAPALAARVGQLLPPTAALRPIYIAQIIEHSTPATPANFIRPPPSV